MKISDLGQIVASIRARSSFGWLIALNLAMTLSFLIWQLLITNFAKQEVGLSGAQWGGLQSLREVPGFLAFLVVYLIIWMREEILAYLALIFLALANILTGYATSYVALLLLTLISSIGFHYYETVNQSLQLQHLPKATAPAQIGLILGAGSALSFVIYAVIALIWRPLGGSYVGVFTIAGIGTLAMLVLARRWFGKLPQGQAQNRGFILRRRYWLFYVLQFLAGARRQIFVVFAGFMMVERFGYDVTEMSLLLLATFLLNAFLAPLIGRMVAHIGERNTLVIEYIGLFLVFSSYAGIYIFDWPSWVGAALYLIDHVFFFMAIAMKTYFQKIADPKDMTATAAVSFTINHIAAVFLPVSLGLIWLANPVFVFALAAVLALCSLCVALLVPRCPEAGNEWVKLAIRQ